MYDNIGVMRMAHGLARHAADRQELVARNVANADTPGYRSRDLAGFKDVYSEGTGATALRATRPGHLGASGLETAARAVEVGGEASPNGNNVSIEEEFFRAAEIKSQHDRATAIYKTSLDILRTSLGRGR